MHIQPARTALLALALVAGCSPAGDEAATITEKRVASVQPRPALPGVSTDERFGGRAPARPATAGAPRELPFAWEVPEGWATLESSQFRLVNLRPAGDPETECYLTLLPQSGGGLTANVNRWRQQMELPPLSEAEVEALPTLQLLGRPAALVDLEGPFQGMTGDPIAEARMLGVILSQPEFTLFLKMTGPRQVVDAEEGGFREFVASLRMRPEALAGAGAEEDPHAGHDHEGHDHDAHDHEGHDHSDGAVVDGERRAEAGSLAWTVPAGWSEGAGSSMRLVTYVPDGAPSTECYVTVLGGDGGGLLSNVNRWREQFGMSSLGTTELMSLPTAQVLGQPSTLVDARGPYRGMDGSVRPDQALLGLVCIRAEGSVFVKMIGPPQEVEAERERFLRFVESMEVAR